MIQQILLFTGFIMLLLPRFKGKSQSESPNFGIT